MLLLTRQLSALYRAGVPILECLLSLGRQSENVEMGTVLSVMSARVAGGTKLSDAMQLFPRVFSQTYVALVRIGEEMGCLHETLERLSGWLDESLRLRRRIVALCTYPAIVLTVTALLMGAVMATFLPRLAQTLEHLDVELPLSTRVLLWATAVVQDPLAWAAGLLLLGAGLLAVRWYVDSQRARQLVHETSWRLPLLGPILRHAALSRYCSAAAILLSSGADVATSLRLASFAADDHLLERDCERAIQTISAGGTLSQHTFARSDLYGRTVPHLLHVGEQTGQVAAMFSRCAEFYRADLEHRMATFTAALEPLLLAGVAVAVGSVVISVFLPLYSMLGRMGG